MVKKNYLATKPEKKIRRHSKVNIKKNLKPTRKIPPFEFLETNKAYNCQKLISERSYKFYTNKVGTDKLGIRTFHKLAEMFLKELRLQMLNNERGVFIQNFGYFGVIKSPKKFKTKIIRVPTEDIKTIGDMYRPIFLPIQKRGSLKEFTMDKGFDLSVYRGINNRLRKNKKYKFVYTVLHNLYGREGNEVNIPIEKRC